MEDNICPYCKKKFKSKHGVYCHINICKQNPNRIECRGNPGFKGKHQNRWLNKLITIGEDTLNITNKQLIEYQSNHNVCEICGRTLEETIGNKENKFKPKRFCIDHDHKTLKFRGLLCAFCNRQLGWYENNKDKIEKYLNKNDNIL